jgi:AbrB family looped-hinge helix DNA binding protein
MGINADIPASGGESYLIRLRERGQITVPREVREQLAVAEGDVVNLVRVGDVYVLSPHPLRVPVLADRIADLMEREAVSLADLLAGLDEERRAIEAKRRAGA